VRRGRGPRGVYVGSHAFVFFLDKISIQRSSVFFR
jgi:hypothetical protein